jgi:transposase
VGVKREQHTAEFKAGVAMAALSGGKTLAEQSTHPTMISKWKLVKRAGEVCACGRKAPAVEDAQKVTDDLHRKSDSCGDRRRTAPSSTGCGRLSCPGIRPSAKLSDVFRLHFDPSAPSLVLSGRVNLDFFPLLEKLWLSAVLCCKMRTLPYILFPPEGVWYGQSLAVELGASTVAVTIGGRWASPFSR